MVNGHKTKKKNQNMKLKNLHENNTLPLDSVKTIFLY